MNESRPQRTARAGWILAAILGLALALPAPVFSDESGDKGKTDEKAKQEEQGKQAGGDEKEPAGKEPEKKAADSKTGKSRVYTNADLRKYKDRIPQRRWPRGRVVSTQAASDVPDEAPDAGIPADEKRRQEAELQGKIGEAEGRIAFIDQRLKSIQNPFLPRPQVSESERQEEAGMDNREISERLKAERAGLQSQLAQLRKELEVLAATPAIKGSQDAAGDETGDTPEP